MIMEIKTGIDILKRERFDDSKRSGDAFLNRIFLPHELNENSEDQLASVFCVKEAIVKALQLSPGSWTTIATHREAGGKLLCTITDEALERRILSFDTSISHDGDYIVAVAVVLLQE